MPARLCILSLIGLRLIRLIRVLRAIRRLVLLAVIGLAVRLPVGLVAIRLILRISQRVSSGFQALSGRVAKALATDRAPSRFLNPTLDDATKARLNLGPICTTGLTADPSRLCGGHTGWQRHYGTKTGDLARLRKPRGKQIEYQSHLWFLVQV